MSLIHVDSKNMTDTIRYVKINYRVHNSPTKDPVESNPHLNTSFLAIRFNSNLLSTLKCFSAQFLQVSRLNQSSDKLQPKFLQYKQKSNRCNSMQIFIHCKTTLHVSGVTAPIIRIIKNCTRSLRYRSYYLSTRLVQTSPDQTT